MKELKINTTRDVTKNPEQDIDIMKLNFIFTIMPLLFDFPLPVNLNIYDNNKDFKINVVSPDNDLIKMIDVHSKILNYNGGEYMKSLLSERFEKVSETNLEYSLNTGSIEFWVDYGEVLLNYIRNILHDNLSIENINEFKTLYDIYHDEYIKYL